MAEGQVRTAFEKDNAMADGQERATIGRRRFLRRAAAVAWATPVIMTLSQSRAGAQSCTAISFVCTPTGLPCCPGLECSQLASGECVCEGSPNPFGHPPCPA